MAETRTNRTHGPGHHDFAAGCAAGELRIRLCAACAKTEDGGRVVQTARIPQGSP
jgi:hypothetical protein